MGYIKVKLGMVARAVKNDKKPIEYRRAGLYNTRLIPVEESADQEPDEVFDISSVTESTPQVKVEVNVALSPEERFFAQMLEYADVQGEPAVYAPFSERWPTYETMDEDQRAWYFYWRSLVRQGEYPETDLAYIYVLIYEILSDMGWTTAKEGYLLLLGLWTHYRWQHRRLDLYLPEWLLDFALSHKLPFVFPPEEDMARYFPSVKIDALIAVYKRKRPLRLPFTLIKALSDYDITTSRFYEGNEATVKAAVPQVIAALDAALRKEKGRGILTAYGPQKSVKESYNLFQGAVCPRENEAVFMTVKPYSTHARLRKYLGDILRFVDNSLRRITGFRGRLSGDVPKAQTAALIAAFLEREYGMGGYVDPVIDAPITKELDFDSIEVLRRESEAVREALYVPEEEEFEEDEEHSQIESITVDVSPEHEIEQLVPEECVTNGMSSLATDELSPELVELLENLSDMQSEALEMIVTGHGDLARLAEEHLTMPEMVVDELNEIAMEILGDLLIDTDGEEPQVFAEYRGVLLKSLN